MRRKERRSEVQTKAHWQSARQEVNDGRRQASEGEKVQSEAPQCTTDTRVYSAPPALCVGAGITRVHPPSPPPYPPSPPSLAVLEAATTQLALRRNTLLHVCVCACARACVCKLECVSFPLLDEHTHNKRREGKRWSRSVQGKGRVDEGERKSLFCAM